jgi:dihydroorotase-like cyclic amidohydrolase
MRGEERVIFIGINPAIDAERDVVFCKNKKDAAEAKAGSLAVMKFDESDLEFYVKSGIPMAVEVAGARDFLLLAATRAKYAIAEIELAKTLQKIADRYVMDIKVLAMSNDITAAAEAGIDGIFASAQEKRG